MNKTRTFFAAILLLLPLFFSAQSTNDYTQYVNPFIGTQTDETGALSGSTFPGATMPQGMVQLSPETEQMVTWDPCSGYDYNKDIIYGFTHTHLSGTGCTDLIDVSLMPLCNAVTPEQLKAADFGQHYSHDKESARPGYYQVLLQESGVNVELSATTRTGIHRYTFPEGQPQSVVLDLDRMTYRGEAYYSGRRYYDILQAQIRLVDDHTIEGYRVVCGWAKLRKVYFRAEFSKPFKQHLLMNGELNVGNSDVVNGRTLRAALSFDPADGQELMVKVAISPVDNEGARKNMLAEAQSWDFEGYVKAAHDIWQRELSRIDIEGTNEQKTIFYTGLYHVLMQPNTMSDVVGRYMDTNFEIKQMPPGQTYHSTFSLWDTFRAAHPLYTLIAPDIAAQFVLSWLRYQALMWKQLIRPWLKAAPEATSIHRLRFGSNTVTCRRLFRTRVSALPWSRLSMTLAWRWWQRNSGKWMTTSVSIIAVCSTKTSSTLKWASSVPKMRRAIGWKASIHFRMSNLASWKVMLGSICGLCHKIRKASSTYLEARKAS